MQSTRGCNGPHLRILPAWASSRWASGGLLADGRFERSEGARSHVSTHQFHYKKRAVKDFAGAHLALSHWVEESGFLERFVVRRFDFVGWFSRRCDDLWRGSRWNSPIGRPLSGPLRSLVPDEHVEMDSFISLASLVRRRWALLRRELLTQGSKSASPRLRCRWTCTLRYVIRACSIPQLPRCTPQHA